VHFVLGPAVSLRYGAVMSFRTISTRISGPAA